MNIPLTIIVPARHEEKIVTKTLEGLTRYVYTPHEVIVVNDSDPSDKTAEIVEHYMRRHPNIRLIHRTNYEHPTFATALTLGFRAVKSGAVLPVMADYCDDAQTIDRMYETMCEGWDIVCGSRYMPGGKKYCGPVIQSLFSKLVNLTLHNITGVPTCDISNSFKLYKKSILKDIPIDQTSGVEISMIITLRAFFTGAHITEIPTTWKGRTVNKSKFRLAERTPRYFTIYLWAVYRSFYRILGVPAKRENS